jgi:pimeloyl-ACP methyl ester carboxylesterase
MDSRFKHRIGKWAIGLLAAYVAGGLLLYFFHELLLFHGKAVPKNYAYSFNQPFEEFNFPRNGDNLNLVRFPSQGAHKGIVLFFHGNMKNVEHYKQYPAFFTRNGYELWMIDYPGFGKTTGKRTEQRMYDDALFFYEFTTKNLPDNRIIIYGKSMGTGPASYLASVRPCKQLVLETPYYNIGALAKCYVPFYPAEHLTKYMFPTNENLKKTRAEVTLIHGTEDEIIPFQQAQRLKKENPSAELLAINGGKHNNLSGFPDFQNKIDSLLKN